MVRRKTLVEIRNKIQLALVREDYLGYRSLIKNLSYSEQVVWIYLGNFVEELFLYPHVLVEQSPPTLAAITKAFGEPPALWPEVPSTESGPLRCYHFGPLGPGMYDSEVDVDFTDWAKLEYQEILADLRGYYDSTHVLCGAYTDTGKVKKIMPERYNFFPSKYAITGDNFRLLIKLVNEINWCGVCRGYESTEWFIIGSNNYRSLFKHLKIELDNNNVAWACFIPEGDTVNIDAHPPSRWKPNR